MCKCGCGTCETKITGPLLTESKVKSLLSEGLNHHISNAIPLHETVYRYGSEKHLALIKEARKLYSRNIIDLNEFDTELVKTHLGEWGVYEGESVPLDLPMMNEVYYQVVANLGDKKTKENLDSFEEVQDFMDKIQKHNAISVDVTKVSERGDSQTIKYDWVGDKWKKVSKSNVNEDLARGYNWPASKATQDRKDMGYDLNDLLAIKNSLKKKGFNVKVGKPTEIDPKIQIQYIDGDLDDLQATLNDMLGGEGYRIVFDTNQPMFEEYTVAGRKVKVNKGKNPNGTDWTVTFPNGKTTDLADVLALIEPKPELTKEQVGNKDIETLITLVKSAKNPKNLPIYFGTRSVGIGQTQYDKGELVDMFNGRELGMDSMDIRNVFFKANQNAEAIADEINASNSGVVAKVEYGYGKKPILYLRKDTNLDEAKKKKKDPPIGKPKRGGSKAYYVYVRDPKTKRIKKVSFGSGGLRAKINNPKARSAFAKRHRCSEKNDRTKPSYWSCRLPRYAKALGLGNNKNTFW